MKQDVNGAAGSQPPLIDRADERLHQAGGVKEAAIATLDRIRAGDLGALPVVVGLAVIWTAFQIISPVFLSANNLVNLLYDSSTIGVIALGIVCILMVGEIDLSVGSTSGFASAVVGSMWVNQGLPVWLALCAAVLTGVLIGLTYSVLFIRFGMPSFIATLAGLLAILGLQLYVLGDSGSINLPYDTPLVTFGQTAFMPHVMAYVAIALAGAATFILGWSAASRRKRASLSSQTPAMLVAKAGILVLAGMGIVAYLDPGQGRALDVRVLRPVGDGVGLRLDSHALGTLGEGGGRQSGDRPARGHQRSAGLHERIRPLLGAGRRGRRDVCGPPRLRESASRDGGR